MKKVVLALAAVLTLGTGVALAGTDYVVTPQGVYGYHVDGPRLGNEPNQNGGA